MMPRPSRFDLITPTPPLPRSRRPAPPADLAPAAALIWQRTLAALPADWIGAEALPLLERYCRHVERVGEIEVLVAGAQPGGQEWRGLVAVAGQETRHVCACARALRLTPQSRLRAETAATAARAHGGALAASATVDDSDGLLAGYIPRRPWE